MSVESPGYCDDEEDKGKFLQRNVERHGAEKQDTHLDSAHGNITQRDLANEPSADCRPPTEEELARFKLRLGELGHSGKAAQLRHMLILLRISKRISEAELAQRLGIDESEVLHDERNEYRGLTTERAVKILTALDIRVQSKLP